MKILTKQGYSEAIDRYQSWQKARLLVRFDVGQKKYGPLAVDGDRDWITERQEEVDDATAYEIFEIERSRNAR